MRLWRRCERGKQGRSLRFVHLVYHLEVLEGLLWSASEAPFTISLVGRTGGGQVSAGACCTLVKTEVLRAAGATGLLGDPLSFVSRPDRWTKTAFGEWRATGALGRPHGDQTEEKSKLTTKDPR